MNQESIKVSYPLTGLHCKACVLRVSNALSSLAENVVVTLSPMQVTLTQPTTDLEGLQTAVAGAGAGVSKYALHAPLEALQKIAERAVIVVDDRPVTVGTGNWLSTYYPLLLIVILILICSVLVQIGGVHNSSPDVAFDVALISTGETMRFFMAGFFIVFAFFKLLDVGAFANAYAGYDLLASRWRGWGVIYPFIELALGLAYLSNWQYRATLWVTIGVMGFSALGVIRAVLSQRKIQCACLGTVFKLPMSTVTIVEDVGMVLMAALMLSAH